MTSEKRPVKVLITNIASLNPGDAALLLGSIKIIQKKYGDETEIIVFDKASEAASALYDWVSFRQALFSRPPAHRFGRWLKTVGYSHWSLRLEFLRFFVAMNLLRAKLPFLAAMVTSRDELEDLSHYVSADLILSSGGTYLIENYQLSANILDYKLSIASGSRLGFFTQTLGPFNKPSNRKAFKAIFGRACVILLRDERSKRHIVELGVSAENIHIAADAAFVLSSGTDATRDKVAAIGSPSERLSVAVSVRSLRYFPQSCSSSDTIDYYDGIILLVKMAVEQYGASITFLSTCQGIPGYWADDADVAKEIVEKMDDDLKKHVKIDRSFRQPTEIVEAYKQFDGVIATRMHACILAMCAGTPTLGVAYEFKMEELFKNAGMPQVVLSTETMSVDSASACLKELLDNRKWYQDYLRVVVHQLNAQAWFAVDVLPDLTHLEGIPVE